MIQNTFSLPLLGRVRVGASAKRTKKGPNLGSRAAP